VRYSGPYGSVRYRGPYYGGYPRYGHYHRWWGGWYWGYPYGWGGGWAVAFWPAAWYAAYAPYWIGGCPTYGFGSVYYGPTYQQYFADEQPVYGVPEVVEEGVPAGPEALPEAVVPAGEEQPVAEPEAQSPDAPGLPHFDAGVKAFQKGDFETAIQSFEAATEAEPDNGELWMGLMHASFAEGEYTTSADALANAAALGGFPRGYRFDPRPAYPSPDTFDQALANLEEHRRTHPDDANAHLVAAYMHLALGDRDEANQAIVRVLELRPGDETAPTLNTALLPPVPPNEVPDSEKVEVPATK
jgi:hypothetical protein